VETRRLGEPIALLNADRSALATGFEKRRPGGGWLNRAIDEFTFYCHECGYPIVERNLCWHSGFYVTGLWHNLELGPVARDIIGARQAARRLPVA